MRVLSVYRHWLKGLLTEIGVFMGFIGLVAIAAAAVTWIFG